MTDHGLIVIGSGPAAIGAAEAFRRHRPDTPIRILTADDHLPYQRPPLSKEYLRGETDDVTSHDRGWFDEHRIAVELGARVSGIDTHARVVRAGGRDVAYDVLVVASGASPRPLPVPGGEGALLLRSLADAGRLRDAAASARSAVVIGAGFIGCEAAASLAGRGLEVTLAAPDEVPQEKRLGVAAGKRLRDLVEAAGARYLGGAEVESIDGSTVHLSDGRTLTADLVVAATGVVPNGDVAEAAGLTVRDGRIVVGADMATDVAGVFAAGDVAMAHNDGAGRPLVVEHWQDATDQGEIAGASAAGQRVAWSGVPGFWSGIGDVSLKYHAWGDGYDADRLVPHDDGFTVWYERDGVTVGVLTLNADDDYDRGEELISGREAAPTA